MTAEGSPGDLFELFEALLSLCDEAREARLAWLEPGQARLLRAMLRADSNAGAALPVVPFAAVMEPQDSFESGQRLGSFVLGRRIGSGGMGQVFAATRIGDTAQRAAIKVQLPFVASDETLRRFRLERQVLARLEHAAIARLIECGEDAHGRPYYAMEWVDGLAIDAHCDGGALGLHARLQLFVRLCEGVDYAHRHLVVHRDIKPGNVMVDAEGQPKLLDFGIAKPLDSQWASANGTATHARVFSPSSAAPEQVRGEPISVACDVYGLGALLYELLSGSPPYRLAGLSPAEIEAQICEHPPLAPSEQVLRLVRGDPPAAERLARLRGFNRAGALVAALRDDLDRIVLHALRKRPNERYPSAAALQADIQRWLRGEAVLARGMGRLYRLRRYVGRHRLASALIGTWMLGLSVITPVLWLQATALRAERDEVSRQLLRAEQERRHAEQVTAFIEHTFALADPGRALGDALSVNDVLDTALRSLQINRVEQPALQHRLQMSLVRVMLSLGRPADAAAALTAVPLVLDQAAKVQRRRAQAEIALALSDSTQALAHSAAALQLLADWPAADPETAAGTWLTRAHSLRASQPEAALQAVDRTLRQLAELQQPSAELRSSASRLRARLLLAVGRGTEGLEELQILLRWQRSTLPAQHPALLETLRLLAMQSGQAGEMRQALSYVEEQLEIAVQVFGESSLRVAHAANARGALNMERGDADAATADYTRCLELLTAKLGPRHSHVAQVLYNLGEVERLLRQRPQQAESYYLRAIDIAAARPEQRVPALFRLGLGSSLLERGQWQQAESEIEHVLAESKSQGGGLHALALGERALLDLRLGRIAAARRGWAQARSLRGSETLAYSVAWRRLERGFAGLGG